MSAHTGWQFSIGQRVRCGLCGEVGEIDLLAGVTPLGEDLTEVQIIHDDRTCTLTGDVIARVEPSPQYGPTADYATAERAHYRRSADVSARAQEDAADGA